LCHGAVFETLWYHFFVFGTSTKSPRNRRKMGICTGPNILFLNVKNFEKFFGSIWYMVLPSKKSLKTKVVLSTGSSGSILKLAFYSTWGRGKMNESGTILITEASAQSFDDFVRHYKNFQSPKKKFKFKFCFSGKF
jgi:hypothetical protein